MRVTTAFEITKDELQLDVVDRAQLAMRAYIDFGLQLRDSLRLPEGSDYGLVMSALVAFCDHQGSSKTATAAIVAKAILSSPDMGELYGEAIERINQAKQEPENYAVNTGPKH